MSASSPSASVGPSDERSLTLLVAVYNEEANLPSTFAALDAALDERSDPGVEVLFVDDGSQDQSRPLLAAYAADRPHVRVLYLTANYGLHTALFAGFEHARAEVVVTLEAHLQHGMRDAFRLVELLDPATNLVAAQRVRRHDPWWRLVGSRLVNSALRRVCRLPFGDVFCLLRVWRRSLGVETFADPSYGWYLASMVKASVRESEVDFSAPRKGRTAYNLRWFAWTPWVLLRWAIGLRLGSSPRQRPVRYELQERA